MSILAVSKSGGSRQQRWAAGFTLIEVMISLAILAIAVVGAFGGLLAASQSMANSAKRQFQQVLLDASIQRWMLTGKNFANVGELSLVNAVQPLSTACPASNCALLPVGAPWVADPSQGVDLLPNDLGTGAYFTIDGLGNITQLSGIAANTPCTANFATVAGGTGVTVYCREILVTTSVTAAGGAAPMVTSAASNWAAFPPALPSMLTAAKGVRPPAAFPTNSIFTLWVRLWKGGSTSGSPLLYTSSSYVAY